MDVAVRSMLWKVDAWVENMRDKIQVELKCLCKKIFSLVSCSVKLSLLQSYFLLIRPKVLLRSHLQKKWYDSISFFMSKLSGANHLLTYFTSYRWSNKSGHCSLRNFTFLFASLRKTWVIVSCPCSPHQSRMCLYFYGQIIKESRQVTNKSLGGLLRR